MDKIKIEASSKSKPAILVVGFGEEIHQAMLQSFNITFIVANSYLADAQWNELYAYKLKGVMPTRLALNDGSYQYVVKNYQRYSDMNSRRYVYVNARESEVFDGFMYYFYWAHNLIINNKPKVVLFHNIPHESFDYILYLLAKFHGIRTIITHQCFLMPDRFWISESMESFGDFDNNPIINEKIKSSYKLPDSWYYMNDVSSKWLYTFVDFLIEIFRKPWRMPVAAIRLYYNYLYNLNREKCINKYNQNSRYIYFPLHLQPELTTSAMGGGWAICRSNPSA